MCSSSSSVNYESVSDQNQHADDDQPAISLDRFKSTSNEWGPTLFPTRRKVAAAPPVTGFVSGRRARTLSHILCVCEKEQQQQQQQEKQREKKAGRTCTLSQSLLAGWLAH